MYHSDMNHTCRQCSAPLTDSNRYPSDAKKNALVCKSCRMERNARSRAAKGVKPRELYTKDVLAYVQEHYGVDQTLQEIADHFSLNLERLENKLKVWRRQGHKIYRPRFAYEEEIRVKGDSKKYIKIGKCWIGLHIYNWELVNGPIPEGYVLSPVDGKWDNYEPEHFLLKKKKDLLRENRAAHFRAKGKKSKPAPVTRSREPKRKPTPVKKEKVVVYRAPKQEVKKYATRVIDSTQYRYVKVNNKTWVAKKIA